jgi:hypothetical protein
MKRAIGTALGAALVVVSPLLFTSDKSSLVGQAAYLGFDRNEYPGDTSLKLLRGKFSFAGFWLNTPPGASGNSWAGKRPVVQRLGFGFLVVFNGRTFGRVKTAGDAVKLGASDGATAVSSARHEGFPPSDDYLSRSRGRRAVAPRAAGLSLCLGRRSAIRRVQTRCVLFGNRFQGRLRRHRHHRRGYSTKRKWKTVGILGDKRFVSAFAGLCFTGQATEPIC